MVPAAGVQSSGSTNVVNVDQSGETENIVKNTNSTKSWTANLLHENTIEDTNSTKSWPASLLQVFDRGTDEEIAAVKASLTTTQGENASVPVKNKAVLMALEIIPLCGPLGIDRFYLATYRWELQSWLSVSAPALSGASYGVQLTQL